MYIRKLKITGLRVFEQLEMTPSPGMNIITGENGSGKTTLLEAIYLLGRGKSFRHKEAGPFIRNGTDRCLVYGELSQRQDDQVIRLGVERSPRSIRVRKNSLDLTLRSDLLQTLPLQIITPQSHELVERGPETRRRFLNYNMFHVEPEYHHLLSDYYKGLKQRNAALRSQNLPAARSFNARLARYGEQLTRQRFVYIEKLQKALTSLLEELGFSFKVGITLTQGWEQGLSLLTHLEKREDQDMRHGFTTGGIHRADLQFRTEGVAAAKRLSRGQQKVLVYLLQLAHFEIMQALDKSPPVFLVDDIAAELDQRNLDRLLTKLTAMGIQAFITATSLDERILPAGAGLFHVEHGRIRDCQATDTL